MGREMIEVDVEELTTKNKLLLSQIQFLNDELCKAKKDLDAEKKKHEDDLEAARSDLVHMVEESVELKNQIQVLQHKELPQTALDKEAPQLNMKAKIHHAVLFAKPVQSKALSA